ncbi:MAG: hypothetical protein QMD61_06575 [Methanobacterium sp.]|nr:hypothetical protein [Methanobacterium sp.]
MISPKVYHKQISELGIEGMVVHAENADEASDLLDELQNIEEILIRIRFNVRIDIRAIRKEYMEKIKNAEKSSETFNSKQKIEKSKLKEKKDLIIERDLKIASYETIEHTVEDYLIQINNSKVYLDSIIREGA